MKDFIEKVFGLRFWLLALGLVAWASVCCGDVVVNEIMALNESGSKDCYGKRSDWVEIYNSGPEDVCLGGWGLSDNEEKPFAFVFPETNLVAGAYLVVRCSGRDVAGVCGEELHTGFKLSGDGEYLGLVDASGAFVSGFADGFPKQYADVAYGIGYEKVLKEVIVEPTGSLCQIYVPKDGSLGVAWTNPSFDDSRWRRGLGGVGYALDEPYGRCLRSNVGAEFADGLACGMYLHYDFVFDRRVEWSRLVARVLCDDGCVLFVNSHEAGRLGVACEGVPAWNERASVSRSHEEAQKFYELDITDGVDSFWTGLNEMAVQVCQCEGAKDILFDMEVVGTCVSGIVPAGVGYLAYGTPGKDNGEAFDGVVSGVSCDVESGFYEEGFSVGLLCPDKEAVIRYTLDGSNPSFDHGFLYEVPIEVSKTTVLKAGAFKEGYLPAVSVARCYVFIADVLKQREGVWPGEGWPDLGGYDQGYVGEQIMDIGMDSMVVDAEEYSGEWEKAFKQIPMVSLTTAPSNLFDVKHGIYVNGLQWGRQWEREGFVEMLPYGDEAGFCMPCGIRLRGGASRYGQFSKHSFHLYFRGEYGVKKLDYPVFGTEGPDKYSKLDLHCVFNTSWAVGDPSEIQIRENFICNLQGRLGHPFKRSRPCHLLLDGQYWGIYWIEQRVDENWCEDELGGEKEDYDVIHIGSVQAGTEKYENQLHDMVAGGVDDNVYKKAQGLVLKGSVWRRQPGMKKLLDPTNVVDITLIYNYTAYEDGPPNNYTAVFNHKDTDGFKFLCHDCEFTLCLYYRDSNLALPWDDPGYLLSPWLHQQLMGSQEYKKFFVQRTTDLLFGEGLMSPEVMFKDIMKTSEMIDSAIILESARWGNTYNWDSFTREEYWRPYLENLRHYFLHYRQLLTIKQFREQGWYPDSEPPRLSIYGGEVERGSKVSIYADHEVTYTIDGSDPMTSETGLVYSEPLRLEHGIWLRAAYKGREFPQEVKAHYKIKEDVPEPGVIGLVVLLLALARRK